MTYNALLSSEIEVGDFVTEDLFAKIKANEDYFNSLIGTFDTYEVNNGSFEIDADSDGIPDTWTRNLYSGGSGAIITAPTGGHGAKSYQFTQPSGASQGGGDLVSDYIPVYRNTAIPVGFQCSTSNGTVVARVQIICYDAAKAVTGSTINIWTSSGTESLDKFRVAYFIPNTGTHFIRIKLIGGEVGPNTSATVVFDGVTMRPHIRRVEVETATISEQTTTNTSYTDVGNLAVTLNQKLYNTPVVILLAAELKASSDTTDVMMRFSVGGAYFSNEMLVSDSKYATGFFMLRYQPDGADSFTIDMEIKVVSSGTAYGQKVFSPILILVEDLVA